MASPTTMPPTCLEHTTGCKPAEQVKEQNPLAEYVPCAAHSLNLVGVSAAESCVTAVDFFGFVQQLYNFFVLSTHRWAIMKSSISPGKEVKVPKNLSQTRWSARADACSALRNGYVPFKAESFSSFDII